MKQIDNQALKILHSTFWSPKGWKKKYTTSEEDLAYAKKAGIMFDPFIGGHDEILEKVLQYRERLCPSDVASAFLASLSTRRLDLRSALGSYSMVRNLTKHQWIRMAYPLPYCSVCGKTSDRTVSHDLNVLNFERHKWGGVRHDLLLYVQFDLEQFSLDTDNQPTEEDYWILRKILVTANEMPADAKLADLVRAIACYVPSNISERRRLITILGYAGILENPQYPGFFNDFRKHCDRERTPWYKDDWDYPVMWWKGVHGVSSEAVHFWFPKIAHEID